MSRQTCCRALTGWALGLVIVVSVEGVALAQIRGDFNGNGVLDASDLDLYRVCDNRPDFDLNGDSSIDFLDRLMWIHELKKTWVGDANLDGECNSSDLVQVFAAGKYETDEEAGWAEGDWNGDMLFTSSDMVAAFADEGYEQGPRLIGDYNRNGQLDVGDLDMQAIAMTVGPAGPEYDLNGDGLIDYGDRRVWVEDLKNTWIGDANLDMEFNTTDLIHIFAGGKYNTGETATWEEGDFTGDMRFDSSDLVAVFVSMGEPGPKPGRRATTVPEPGAGMPLALGLILVFLTARRCTPSGDSTPQRV